jgi:hypothetical protein
VVAYAETAAESVNASFPASPYFSHRAFGYVACVSDEFEGLSSHKKDFCAGTILERS